MIPVRLNLRNFMCYTDVHRPLEFDGIEVACLCGDNGHGKSALLDAITWALWGKARARTVDELIYQGPGVTEMEVEFEFRLEGDQYRVIRKRTRRGRGGQTVLELAIRDREAGRYRPLTGNNVSETEQQLERLLRMSYETFTSSAFILQGKADSFTTRTPAERKQVLAEILDLSRYEQLEALARQRMSERNEQATVLQQQILDDDEELRREPELRNEQARLESDRQTLEERITLGEASCEALRERLGRLKAAERDLQDQERRLQEARVRAERQRRLLAAAEAALERARRVLGREQEIEAGYAALAARRIDLERLASIQVDHGRLAEQASRVQQVIAEERGRLEGCLRRFKTQLAADGAGPDLQRQRQEELAAARAELEALERLSDRRDQLNQRLADERERLSELRAGRDHVRAQLAESKEHQQLLSDSPTCPVCRTALGSERHRNLIGQYRKEEERFADLVRKAERDEAQIVKLGTSLRQQLDQLEARLKERPDLQRKLGEAQRNLAQVEQQAQTLEALRTEAERAEAALAQEDYALQARQELAETQKRIEALGYDGDRHQAAVQEVARLAEFDSLHRGLDEARRTIVREEQARAEAAREVAEADATALSAGQRASELKAETADLAGVEAKFRTAEVELREQRLEHGRLLQELGAVRGHLTTMEFTARRRDQRRAELDRVLCERENFRELGVAFGRNGLQAMLIETAIPEIQDEANRLLALMTDGRMRVSLETQRTGTAGNQIDTLNIKIRDELGERNYELYSGGEAFRVNFAIRIALSKLLARRAGASLQTLVIDEGFGSQDEQGRERLVEAIQAIQPEFKKIIVITHLADFKELFPTRIQVTKTPAGSVIDVD